MYLQSCRKWPSASLCLSVSICPPGCYDNYLSSSNQRLIHHFSYMSSGALMLERWRQINVNAMHSTYNIKMAAMNSGVTWILLHQAMLPNCPKWQTVYYPSKKYIHSLFQILKQVDNFWLRNNSATVVVWSLPSVWLFFIIIHSKWNKHNMYIEMLVLSR